MRRNWKVAAEQMGVIEGSNKRPDIVVRREGLPPLVIENEFMPARNVESEARERLGLKLTSAALSIPLSPCESLSAVKDGKQYISILGFKVGPQHCELR